MTYCFTCRTTDTVQSNGDNACCTSCGDPEGYIYFEDYEDELVHKIFKDEITTKTEAREYRL